MSTATISTRAMAAPATAATETRSTSMLSYTTIAVCPEKKNALKCSSWGTA
jgi:hypothetical protein